MNDAEHAELARLAENKLVLELGTGTGVSSEAMAATASTVHTVDWHKGDPHAGEGEGSLVVFADTLMSTPGIVAHIGRFADVLQLFKDHLFGLVVIDGYHTVEAVTQDINLSYRLLQEGGVMAFHDYTIPQFGVKTAIDEDDRLTVVNVVDSLAVCHTG